MLGTAVATLTRPVRAVLEALHGAWLLGGLRRDRRPDWLLGEMLAAPSHPEGEGDDRGGREVPDGS